MVMLSRRQFVAQAGAGAVAVATGLHLPAQPTPTPAPTQPALPVPHYAYDPQAQAVVDQLIAFNAPPPFKLTPENARQLPTFAYAVQEVLAAQHRGPALEPVGGLSHLTIPGPAGQLVLRVYTPQGSGPFPVVVYFHGGGWMLTTLDTWDSSCRALTNAVPCIVVSVGYRNAPEHKFPAAIKDAYAATQWVLTNAAAIGGDPKRVAVAGESAGGTLAAVVALMARDKGGAMPVHQLLMYPATDLLATTPSKQLYTATRPLSTPLLTWFYAQYLRTPADAANPYASPLRASSLAALPPATVISAEFDPLRDEDAAYAAKLRAAGVAVTATQYKGMIHAFFGMGAVIDQANHAVAQAAAALRTSFS